MCRSAVVNYIVHVLDYHIFLPVQVGDNEVDFWWNARTRASLGWLIRNARKSKNKQGRPQHRAHDTVPPLSCHRCWLHWRWSCVGKKRRYDWWKGKKRNKIRSLHKFSPVFNCPSVTDSPSPNIIFAFQTIACASLCICHIDCVYSLLIVGNSLLCPCAKVDESTAISTLPSNSQLLPQLQCSAQGLCDHRSIWSVCSVQHWTKSLQTRDRKWEKMANETG